METTDASSLSAEIEKLAEGFESRDFPFAATCATKIIEGLAGQAPSDDVALSTHWIAEARKSIKALESKEFSLAAMCLRKAVKSYAGQPAIVGVTVQDAPAVRRCFEEIALRLGAEEFPNVGVYVRKLANKLTYTDESPEAAAEPTTAVPARELFKNIPDVVRDQ